MLRRVRNIDTLPSYVIRTCLPIHRSTLPASGFALVRVTSHPARKYYARGHGEEGVWLKSLQIPRGLECEIDGKTAPPRTGRHRPVRHLAYWPVCSALCGMTIPITPPSFQIQIDAAGIEQPATSWCVAYRPPCQMPYVVLLSRSSPPNAGRSPSCCS